MRQAHHTWAEEWGQAQRTVSSFPSRNGSELAKNDKVESLCVRISGKANMASILVGVCYRLPDHDEETLYSQLAEVAKSSALVLVGDFNFPDISWKYNTAQRKQSKRFLDSM